MSEGDGGAITSRRRRLLNWLAGLSIVSFVLGLIVPLKDLAVVAESVGADQASNLPGQRLVFAHAHQLGPDGHEHEEGSVVTVETLGEAPTAALVYPEDLSQQDNFLISIHNLETEMIEPPTDPELTDQGFVAYSAICTHLGCTVDWSTDPHEVGSPHDHCPCHVGEFDPYHGAEVMAGPPPRALPQIGIQVNDDDEFEITTQFNAEVGSE